MKLENERINDDGKLLMIETWTLRWKDCNNTSYRPQKGNESKEIKQ